MDRRKRKKGCAGKKRRELRRRGGTGKMGKEKNENKDLYLLRRGNSKKKTSLDSRPEHKICKGRSKSDKC